jgi:hypothetical protein
MHAIAQNSHVSNILNALRVLVNILNSMLYKANGQEEKEGPPEIQAAGRGKARSKSSILHIEMSKDTFISIAL